MKYSTCPLYSSTAVQYEHCFPADLFLMPVPFHFSKHFDLSRTRLVAATYPRRQHIAPVGISPMQINPNDPRGGMCCDASMMRP